MTALFDLVDAMPGIQFVALVAVIYMFMHLLMTIIDGIDRWHR